MQLNQGRSPPRVAFCPLDGDSLKVIFPLRVSENPGDQHDGGILVALARKPFQRRPVETGEEIVAALLQMLHHLRVDLRYAVANGVVQLDQGEEAPVTQLAEHEARDDADGGLDLGLVAWASNARRQHDEAVVIGEILIQVLPGAGSQRKCQIFCVRGLRDG